MHALEYLRDPSRVPVRQIYAIPGDDVFLKQEVLTELGRQIFTDEEAAELGTTRFAGDSATLADVLDEVRTLPFLTGRRLVVVLDADPFVTAHRQDLETFIEHNTSGGILVLSVRTWLATTRLAKLVDRVGLAIDCSEPPERALQPWLVHRARSKFRAVLEEDAAEHLIQLVGPETGLLASELEKLAVAVGERGRVEFDDVSPLVGAGRVEKIWKVVEAATTGRGAQALEWLDRLLASGESPVQLLAGASFTLRKLHHAGELRHARLDLKEACRRAGIWPSAVAMTQEQHAHLGPRRVKALPALLLQADLDLKGASTLSQRVVLEKLLITLAQPRTD
jgi:DNA polymerase-3 subunit delta